MVENRYRNIPDTFFNLKKDSQVKLNLNLTCAGADKTKGSVVVKVVMRSTTCTGMNLLGFFQIYFYIAFKTDFKK